MTIGSIVTGIIFIFIQFFASRWIPSTRIRRAKWLSLSGGIAVSYVFVYVLPAMHEHQATYAEADHFAMESELYSVGLLGVLAIFGIKKLAHYNQSRARNNQLFFAIELGFFCIYNMLISYVVITTQVAGWQAVFYSTAIGLHFLAVAHDLWRENAEMYEQLGRYFLVIAIATGWIAGNFFVLPSPVISMIFAFVSGAMIINVLKDEVPANADTHFSSFMLGSVLYTVIVLTLKFFFEW
ncbi:DUF3270 family protein [Evansella cellulosilytica]|uniref:Uncharacterized protein n=1 Tax=Evansella cellulosilytica (strain ATCC 21833 / DSM 2522 / FERM P-1141 / JCM 9156 / N-4) TaxID=649639 RepID=E6U1B5_EVAC2|nr:DUF3270 family protein [Evansella cellulosilytica]ADU29162.1 hypothetical protein Bcell_0886 [Evansella cellulosilytica DSM 2522]